MSAAPVPLEPAANGATWPCGHPRTPANTQSIGKAGERCKICRREIGRASMARHRAADRPGFIVQTGWPSRTLSPNGRAHWSKLRAASKIAKADGYYATAQAMPKGWTLAPGGRFKITIAARPPTNRRRDDDNLIASAKHYLDGIAARLGVDDSCFDLAPVIWQPAARPGRLLIEIEPAP
jgi:crossover junction endodeoxyribonuclease RusA